MRPLNTPAHTQISALLIPFRTIIKLLAVSLVIASVPLALYVRVDSKSSKTAITVKAAGRGKPYLNLQDGRAMQVSYHGDQASSAGMQNGAARSRSIATADFDGDAAPDVVAGFAYNGVGILTMQRGNPEGYAPTDDSVFTRMQEGYDPAPLLPTVETYQLSEAPDFLTVGDFNQDGRNDVLVAARGGNLHLLAGDGEGRLEGQKQINLPGLVTALTAGEFRAADGARDVAVAIEGPGGPEVFVFDGAAGGFDAAPFRFGLRESAVALEFGELDSDPFMDLAIAAGREIKIVHGWGRKTNARAESRVERIALSYTAQSFAVDNFTWDRQGTREIAVLSAYGDLHVLEHSRSKKQPFSEEEILARSAGRGRMNNPNADVEVVEGWAGSKGGWNEVTKLVLNAGVREGATQGLLTHGKISTGETNALMVLNTAQRRLDVVHQVSKEELANSPELSLRAGELSTTSLDATAAPAAMIALPRKLNGVQDLVVLSAEGSTPSLISIAPNLNFGVNTTSDHAPDGACNASPDCTFREAVIAANANPGPDTVSLPAGTYTLTIIGNTNNAGAGEGFSGNAAIGDVDFAGVNGDATTVTGAGAGTTFIVQSTANDRTLEPNPTAELNFDWTISGVTIAGGRDTGGSLSGGGGAMLSGSKDNITTITNCVIANNRASGTGTTGGGAILNEGGTVTITNTTIGGAVTVAACPGQTSTNCGNSSSASGGGIVYSPGDPLNRQPSAGTMTIQTTSSFTNNTSSALTAGGGGVTTRTHNLGTGSVSISGTTFTTNNALGTASGGGLFVESIATTVATTAFNNNSAGNRGGGIQVAGGSLTLNGTSPSITFTGNTATTAGSSISASSAVTLQGTNTTIGGDLEITTNGVWTNAVGSAMSPNNLIIIGTGSFTANNSTTNVSGNFQFQSGTFNAGTGLFNFNGSAAQTINNSVSITFNNLTDSNITNPLTINNSIVVNGTLNMNGAGSTLAPLPATVISGAGTLNGTGTVRVTRTGANAFLTQYTITNKTLTSLLVDYVGAAAQGLSLTTYGALRINNTSGVTLESGTATVNGLLTLTAGALNVGAAPRVLVINNGIAVGAGTLTSGADGTVNYNQGSDGQSVIAGTYGNLTFSNFNKVLASSGTIGIAGVFTTGTAVGHTIAGSTINFNGAGAQTIPVFNYNNLTSSAAGTRTLANTGIIGIAGIFTPGTNVYTITGSTIDYNGSGAQTISAFNYNNLTSSNVGGRTLANSGTIGIAGVFTPGGNGYTIAGSTINFNGAVAQNIPAFNYFNLSSSNVGARTLANAGTIGIAGAFAPGSNVYTITGSTIDFNGAGPQTIPAFNYNNLTSSNVGARTLANSGTIGIAGVFTPGTNAYTITLSTINFNGAVPQTIPAFNYNNLTSSNTGTRTLANTGNIGIAGVFTPGTNVYTITGSTIVYNGTAAQTMPNSFLTYNNLTLSNPAGVSGFAGTINVLGNWTNTTAAGFSAAGSTVNFNGSGAQVIGGTQPTTFNNLTIANSVGGVSLGQNINVNGILTLTNDLNTSTFTLTMPNTGTSAGPGDVIGNVRRTGFTGGGPALSFGNPFNTIGFIAQGTVPTDILVNLVKAAPVGPPAFPTAVLRTYTITPTGGSGFSATLRLHYLDGELNSNVEAGLGLFRLGAAWARQGKTASDTVNNWVELSGVSQLSQWTLSSALNDTTTSITSDLPDPSGVNQVVTVNYSVTSNVGGAPPVTGNVTITVDDASGDTCMGTVAAGTCALTLTTLGSKTLTATYSGDVNFNGSSDTEAHEVVPVDVVVKDSHAAEPTSGTTTMLFTVTLSGPSTGAASVNYATADNGSAVGGTCVGGADYETTSGLLNFNTGQQIQTIPVVVCSDGTAEPDETFLMNLSSPVNLTITDGQATGTITAANPPGTVLISEVRTSGPGGVDDDFVEIYNNTTSPLVVAASDASAGYGLFKMGAACGDVPVLIGTIPNGTNIPARGHYLVVGSAYSLSNYGGTGAAAANLPLTTNIESDRNIALFTTTSIVNLSTETRLDAVGFGANTGNNCDLLREGTNLLAAGGSTSEYSFVRKLASGTSQDTNDNNADLALISTTPATPVGSNAAPLLGGPGPENLASPLQRNGTIKASLIDPAVASSLPPNRIRDTTPDPNPANNSALGTLDIRRKFTNNTGFQVTRLRFRLVDITSGPAAPGTADLRARTSDPLMVVTSGGTITVNGTTVELPPAQPNGGGLNSTMTVTVVPIANGASVDLRFLLGVQQGGGFRFFVNVEALP